METSSQSVSPLRQRMLEDMRKLAPKTREGCIRAVSRFAKYLGRSPDTATAQDLRLYQLHLVDSGTITDTTLDESTRPNFVCTHCGARMLVVESIVRGQAIRAPPSSLGDP